MILKTLKFTARLIIAIWTKMVQWHRARRYFSVLDMLCTTIILDIMNAPSGTSVLLNPLTQSQRTKDPVEHLRKVRGRFPKGSHVDEALNALITSVTAYVQARLGFRQGEASLRLQQLSDIADNASDLRDKLSAETDDESAAAEPQIPGSSGASSVATTGTTQSEPSMALATLHAHDELSHKLRILRSQMRRALAASVLLAGLCLLSAAFDTLLIQGAIDDIIASDSEYAPIQAWGIAFGWMIALAFSVERGTFPLLDPDHTDPLSRGERLTCGIAVSLSGALAFVRGESVFIGQWADAGLFIGVLVAGPGVAGLAKYFCNLALSALAFHQRLHDVLISSLEQEAGLEAELKRQRRLRQAEESRQAQVQSQRTLA